MRAVSKLQLNLGAVVLKQPLQQTTVTAAPQSVLLAVCMQLSSKCFSL